MLNQSIPLRAVVRQSPIIFVATLSCTLSFWLTLRFFTQICPGEGAFELWAIGALWEAAKIVFSTAGLRDWRSPGHQTRGAFLLGLAAILAVGSVVASLGFVSAADSQGRQQALVASVQYQRAQRTWESLHNQIEALTATSQEDRAQSFRTRGLRTLEQVEPLRKQIDAIAAELQAMEAGGHKMVAPESQKATLFASERWRLTGQCVLSIMLELIGIAAMTLLGGQSAIRPAGRSLPPDNKPAAHQAPALRCVSSVPLVTSTPLDRYQTVRRQVMEGQLRPGYRPLQEAFLISQSTAQRYLRRMHHEGVLCQVGRSYAVTHTAAAGGAA